MLATRYPLLATWLRRYFYSGWAFLMPYLFVYLLYYVTKWPVNAPRGTEQLVAGSQHGWVPCMLHVYWALHAIHVILAGFALWSWGKNQTTQRLAASTSNVVGLAPEGQPLRQPSAEAPDEPLDANRAVHHLRLSAPSGLWPLVIRLAPWALLALLFYIPGVYLEWPSDPWEHLRRINEWRVLDTVGAHSSWMKSAYFIPYSLLSWCMGLRQLFWLDFYYTGICLLLCWQYYRFSRACGLGERASMVFVIIQALLFGNNIFSFYRYYGISSSIYAQLGAIALTRIVLRFASQNTELQRSQEIKTESNINRRDAEAQRGPGKQSSKWNSSFLRFFAVPSACLLLLTAFNHPQGLGIAGLGIAAIIIWRLIEWKRSVLWWLIGGTLIINVLFLWLHPRPPIIEAFRVQGWLNAWYGFNILKLTSPAGDRMLQIVSAFGLVNLATALFLLRRNQVIVWLSITPFLVLLIPCISIPFAIALSQHGDVINIITFQRLLFAIPPGLVLTLMGSRLLKTPIPDILPTALLAASLAGIFCLPAKGPQYNRTWHSLTHIPADLQMTSILAIAQSPQITFPNPPKFITTYQTGAVLQASGVPKTIYAYRMIGWAAVDFAANAIAAVAAVENRGALVYIPSFHNLSANTSLAGLLSTHWSPQEVAIDLSAGAELNVAAINAGAVKIPISNDTLFELRKTTSESR